MKRKKQYTEFSYPQTNTNSQQQDATTKKGYKKNNFPFQRQVRCYVCDSPDHLAHGCKANKSESHGRKNWVVRTEDKPIEISTNNFQSWLILFSHPLRPQCPLSDKEVTQTKSIEVQIEVLPIRGIIDTGSDIIILSGTAFQEIVTACGIKREQFKPPDRTVCTYGHQPPLKLDGQLDLQIKFGQCVKKCMLKLDAPVALLLSENVCCKLNIVTYHPDVQSVLPATDQSKVKNREKTRKPGSVLSRLFTYLLIVQLWFR